MNSQELARKLYISTGYLSQLESGVRVNPSTELLKQLSEALVLDTEETYMLYDLYAKANNTVSPDIAEYISQHDVVAQALRVAKGLNATDNDWLRFIEQLKNEQ